MNSVCLVGRLTRDPELRTTNSGISNCRFSLAVEGMLNQDGERQVDFINIVTWRNVANNVAKYCKKGSMVGITGRIATGSYQAQDGSTRYTTDVVADSVKFLNSKSDNNSSIPSDSMENQVSQSANLDEDPFKDFSPADVVLSDDDLPF